MVDEVRTYYVPQAAVAPSSDVSQAEWETLEDRVDVLEDGISMDDITDGRATGIWTPNDGDIWRYNEPAGFWEPFPLANTIESITDTDSVDLILTGTALSAAVKYGGSGSANTAARSDHVLSAPVGKRATFAATGVLSSGTRNLVTTTFGPLTSGITYDIDARFLVRARNNVNSGTFNLLCRVGTDGAYPQLSRNVQTVGGVPVDQHIDFGDASGDMVAVGAGSNLAISFSAQFSTGDAVDLRDGYYRVVARPRR